MPLDEVVLKAAEAAVVAAPLLRGKRARPSLSDQRQPSTRASIFAAAPVAAPGVALAAAAAPDARQEAAAQVARSRLRWVARQVAVACRHAASGPGMRFVDAHQHQLARARLPNGGERGGDEPARDGRPAADAQ